MRAQLVWTCFGTSEDCDKLDDDFADFHVISAYHFGTDQGVAFVTVQPLQDKISIFANR